MFRLFALLIILVIAGLMAVWAYYKLPKLFYPLLSKISEEDNMSNKIKEMEALISQIETVSAENKYDAVSDILWKYRGDTRKKEKEDV